MVEATYVLFVPTAKRTALRGVVAEEGAGQVTWRERRKFFGSEFYVSGPAAAAREAHAAAARWLAKSESGPR